MRDASGRYAPGPDREFVRRHQLALPWPKVDDLDADQLAAMQTMDDARREGVLSDGQVRVIEAMIRRGHTAGARKRVTLARKAARS